MSPTAAKRPANGSLPQPLTKRASLETPDSRLESLPEELLENIILRSVDDPIGQDDSTLGNLLRVSRTFRRISEPRRYMSFVYTYKTSESFPLFLRTLLQRPDLAANVYDVKLEDAPCETVLNRSDLTEWEIKQMRTLVNEVMPWKVGLKDAPGPDFLRTLMHLKEVVLSVLLILLLPNLQTLELAPPWVFPIHVYMQHLQSPAPWQRPPLSRLRSLTLTRGDPEQERSLIRLSSFLSAPALRTVFVECPLFRIFEDMLEPHTSNVETVVFRCPEIRPRDMDTLAQSCKALTTLAIVCPQQRECYELDRVTAGEAERLHETLLSQQDSLERLVLAITDKNAWRKTDIPYLPNEGAELSLVDVPALASLKQMHRLKALSVSAQLLTGVCLCPKFAPAHVSRPTQLRDWLPRGLEVLTLNAGLDDYHPPPYCDGVAYHVGVFRGFMEDLARAGREVMPVLRLVEVYLYSSSSPWERRASDIRVGVEWVEALRPVFAAWGVELVEVTPGEGFRHY